MSEQNALKDVKSNLSLVENTIRKLPSTLDQDDGELDPRESAKLNVGLAFALSSLYSVLLNCKGAKDSKGTPRESEIVRVNEYLERIKKMDKIPEVRKLNVDSAAAARMVKHNLDLVGGGDKKKRKTNG
jgi:hypothetical protein